MQSASPAVGIEGVALERSDGDPTRNLMELIFSTVRAALDDASRSIHEVDTLILAAHDLVDGRSLSSMVTAPAAGAYMRDEMRVTDDGLVALSLGAATVQSGHAQRTLVAAWGRPSEADVEAASAAAYDPFTEQPFALDDAGVSALRASAYLRRFGRQSAARRTLVDHRLATAAENPRGCTPLRPPPRRSPLLEGELSTLSDTVAAVLVTRSEGCPQLTGIGHGSESFALGERDLTGMPAASQAVRSALDGAGVSLAEVDVFELAGRSVIDEVLVAEAIGLVEPGRGCADIARYGHVNPSGGGAAGESPPATGLARFVEAVMQLRGDAGAVQLPGACRRALVVSGSAVAAQTQTAVVVEAP
jgi:hypothetical protein